MTPAAANALRMEHETAVWNAIQSSGEGNPPSSAAGGATAAAMIEERSRYNAFAANPTPANEAAFVQAHNTTAARFQAWKGRPAGSSAANLTTTSSTGPSAGTVAGVSVPLLLVGGAALWYFMRKKGGGGKKKLFGLL